MRWISTNICCIQLLQLITRKLCPFLFFTGLLQFHLSLLLLFFLLLTEIVKKLIKENWDFLLEKVDYLIISETFAQSQNIGEIWQNVCHNSVEMSKKVRARFFLQYIRNNEEWLLPFYEVFCKQNLSFPGIMPCWRVNC